MQAHDIDAVKALFLRVYGYARTSEEDMWRYTNTESGLPPVMLAEKEGALVGSYAVWPTRIVCGDEIIHSAQALDIMVDPAHNGKGLFTLMGEAMFRELETRGVKMLYGFPNPPSFVGHTRKMSWHHVANIPRYIRVIHPLHRFGFIPKIVARTVHRIFDITKPVNNSEVIYEKPSPKLLENIIRNTTFSKYS
jgi:GNAT superfamily N-acetyltransferase